MIDPGVVSSPLYERGDNVRNTGNLDFFATLTKTAGFPFGATKTPWTPTRRKNNFGNTFAAVPPRWIGWINPFVRRPALENFRTPPRA